MAKGKLKDKIFEHKLRKRRWIALAAVATVAIVAVVIVIQVLVWQGVIAADNMMPAVAQLVATTIGVVTIGVSMNGFYKEKAQIDEMQKRMKRRDV